MISTRDWNLYLDRLRAVNDAAYEHLLAYIQRHRMPKSWDDVRTMIDYAFGLSTKYGEAAAALACEMYDAVALASDVITPAAEPAATATWNEVAKAVQGTLKTGNAETVAGSVSRLVKMAGVDTTMKNAVRDGAEWAWIPKGLTCAFCVTLASRGWQPASRKALKGGHAEHIHANCDCTYAIRFDPRMDVEGYTPDRYLDMYNATRGTPKEKINAMRRAAYAENKAAGMTGSLLESSVSEELRL